MNTTQAAGENKAWKIQAIQDMNPWPLQYRCGALPTELIWFSHSHLLITSRVYYEPT